MVHIIYIFRRTFFIELIPFILDTTIHNCALIVENTVYTEALVQFDDQAFEDADMASLVHPRSLEIAARGPTVCPPNDGTNEVL